MVVGGAPRGEGATLNAASERARAREAAGLAAALARVREWSAADRARYAPARAAIRAAAEAAGLVAVGAPAAAALLGEPADPVAEGADEYAAPDPAAAARRLADAAFRGGGDAAYYSLALPKAAGALYEVRVDGRALALVRALWRSRARLAAREPFPAAAAVPAAPFARAAAPFLALAAEALRLAAGGGDAARAGRLWALVAPGAAVGGRGRRGRGNRERDERGERGDRGRSGERDERGRSRSGERGDRGRERGERGDRGRERGGPGPGAELAGGGLVPLGARAGRVARYATGDAAAARLRLAAVPGGEVRANDPEMPGDARLRRLTLKIGGRPVAEVYNLLEYEAVQVDAAGALSPWAAAYLRLADAWVATLVLAEPAAAVREALADVAAAVAAAPAFEPAGYAGRWESEFEALKREAEARGRVEFRYWAGEGAKKRPGRRADAAGAADDGDE